MSNADTGKTVPAPRHPDFKTVEASRPSWRDDASPSYTKTRKPDWKAGEGATDGGENLKKSHVEIDPYAEGRPSTFNYKLLISAIVPRPIGFVSTTSADGKVTNLSPFSFFQVMGFDPPLFVIGFSCSLEQAKDTLKNLVDTKECVINIISEDFIEAANMTSINAPYGVSEFPISGLHPAESRDVKAPRVKEAVFSIEANLVETREYRSRRTDKVSCTMAVVEGVRFWAREDAVNEERNALDISVLRPMSRLGGISYGRLTDCIELPRPDWNDLSADEKENFESESKSV
ncbi:hypothetical protein MYCGRDRAFT_48694 [Paecilomyces variotii No. 5]|uniref:Flavin reductase like domain-containing protein n=1 Tax=Byssochlamys spectabilis (strain No. 5 / NBRC 109023) TaxID=1356009 RepID=V5G0F2_BYSSN|nr:hypothetical protein MYCGRDRAFT_48694 [Paecilomyces variotii No. 5]